MKTLNKKSDCYYINKIVYFQPLNISKVHLIDENCNEFICTVVGCNFVGYCGVNDVKVIDYEDYTSDKWDEMVKYIEYEKAVILG